MPLPPASRLGPYEILSPLGAGGMGEVYRARDTRLGREVAIKVLPEDISRDPARRQRFEHEARTAGSLSHPNLLTIFDVGAENDSYYLVTELVEGDSLRATIRNGPLSPRRLGDIGAQIAEGLAVAHAAGVVHRDLKPENIMLGRDGRVRILDFGLAKTRARAAGAADGETATSPMTDPGTVLGTTAYMCPEQVRGEEVDGRSDLFSLGIVLYELASGKRPFLKPTSVETMTAILREDVEQFPEALGPSLTSILRRCLEKDPARRFQSAADLAFSLRHHASGSTTIQAIAPPLPSRSWRGRAATGALAALVGAASFFGGRLTSPEKPVEWTVRPLTAYPGLELQPALSPDGSQIAFTWMGESGTEPGIYVRLVDSEPPLKVSTGPGNYACWSPNGKRIAFRRGDEILTVPALGGAERRLAEFGSGNRLSGNLSWSPDGSWIAVPTTRGISAIVVQTGEIREWAHLPGKETRDAAFSPDGRRLAFMSGAAFSNSPYLLNAPAGGATPDPPRRISSREFDSSGLAWRADGNSLIVSSTLGSRLMLWRVDAADGATIPLPVDSASARSPSISYSGARLAYARTLSDYNMWRADAAGSGFGEARPFIRSTGMESDIQFCAGGQRIVFRSERTGESVIWRAERDGSNQIPILRVEGARSGSPRCSPDGRLVLFDAFHNGNIDLYIGSIEGGEAKRLTATPWDESRAVFTLDGKTILFALRKETATEIWKMPLEGGDGVQITTTGGHEPFPAPDGLSVYYTRRNASGIWRIPLAGGQPTLVCPFGQAGQWAVAGGNLYWGDSATAKIPGHVSVFDPVTRKTTRLLTIPAGVDAFSFATSLTVAPDAKTIVFTRRDRSDSDLMLVENFR